jgi:hypothetical protein
MFGVRELAPAFLFSGNAPLSESDPSPKSRLERNTTHKKTADFGENYVYS